MRLFLEILASLGVWRMALLLSVVLGGYSASAVAQSDLLKQGTDLLKKYGGGVSATGLSTEEISAGLLDALKVGTQRVVRQVGREGGYLDDSNIHIPLPDSLATVQKALGVVGLSQLADDLEVRINRGAEAAAPEAKAVFFKSIKQMTWQDAQAIYQGPDDAATQYFKKTMSPELVQRFTPIVEKNLNEAGAVRAYDEMMSEYQTLPLVPDVKSNLGSYAVEKSLDGLFFYLAKEEAAIRNNPAKRSTDLLKKVFGSP
jgi:hypothetical protein